MFTLREHLIRVNKIISRIHAKVAKGAHNPCERNLTMDGSIPSSATNDIYKIGFLRIEGSNPSDDTITLIS